MNADERVRKWAEAKIPRHHEVVSVEFEADLEGCDTCGYGSWAGVRITHKDPNGVVRYYKEDLRWKPLADLIKELDKIK